MDQSYSSTARKTPTMTLPRPSSPPPHDLYHNLQRIAQHNATTPSQHHSRGVDVGTHTLSPRSNVDSTGLMQPAASSQMLPSYHQILERTSYPEIHDFSGNGFTSQYNGYGPPPTIYYTTENGSYHDFPYKNEVREKTPVTPKSTPIELIRRTRSGRTLVRSNSPQASRNDSSRSRVIKSPKVKTPKQKAVIAKTPKLEKPLSELTKDMIDVPVRDIEAWVNRPAAVRQKEAEKRNGYVTRPMNSFMLYRSAFAERTKAWCVQNNHQVVSSVSGESWPLEPAELREQYNEYARIERANHASAHPDYKFQPSKGPSSPPRRKKQNDFDDDEDDEDDDDDFSDVERSDSEWKPRSGRPAQRTARATSAKRQTLKSELSLHANHIDNAVQQQPQPRGLVAPHYGMDTLMADERYASSWASGPTTDIYGTGHYFPSTMLSSSAPSGMPHGHMPYYVPSTFHTDMSPYHPELVRLHSYAGTPLQVAMGMPMHTSAEMMQHHHVHEAQVDPMLLQLDNSNMMQYEGFGEGVAMPTGDGAGGQWPGDVFGSSGGHFEQWMTSRDGS